MKSATHLIPIGFGKFATYINEVMNVLLNYDLSSEEENLNDEFKQILIKEHGFVQSVKIEEEVCNLPASTLIKTKTTKEKVFEIVNEVCDDLSTEHVLVDDLLERCFITEVSLKGIKFIKGKSYKS